jgi:hypothetical protein
LSGVQVPAMLLGWMIEEVHQICSWTDPGRSP